MLLFIPSKILSQVILSPSMQITRPEQKTSEKIRKILGFFPEIIRRTMSLN
jgi:hypothetical protein